MTETFSVDAKVEVFGMKLSNSKHIVSNRECIIKVSFQTLLLGYLCTIFKDSFFA